MPSSPPRRREPEGVPPGRFLDIGRRGQVYLRDVAGPPRSPTVVLLHGLVATAAINWLPAFGPLSSRFTILAPDLRGHGRGPRSEADFSLEECADDVASMLDELDVQPVIAVGYSMGGPIAQLLWRRHPEHVAGLVLAATAASFVGADYLRVAGTAIFGAASQTSRWTEITTRLPLRGVRALMPPMVPAEGSMGRWAADELGGTDIRAVLDAIRSIAAFDSRPWMGQLDVPSAVVVTTRDRAVSPLSQLRLARQIGADLYAVAEGHTGCSHPLFAQVLNDACASVADRIEGKSALSNDKCGSTFE